MVDFRVYIQLHHICVSNNWKEKEQGSARSSTRVFLWQTGVTCLVWVVDLVFARLGVSHQWQLEGGFWHGAGPVEDTLGARVLLSGALDQWWQCSGSRLWAHNGLWLRKTVCPITPNRGGIRMQWGISLACVPGFPSEGNQNACGKGADLDLFCSGSGRHQHLDRNMRGFKVAKV